MTADVQLRIDAELGNVKQVLTGLEKQLEKQGNKLNALNARNRKNIQGLKVDFESAAKSASRIAQNVTGVGSAVDLASKGIGVLKREFDDLVQRQNKAKQTQLTFVQAFDQAVLNLGPGETGEDLQKRINKISKETGVAPRDVAVSISSGLSSKGVLTTDQLEDTLSKVLKLSANAPDLQAPLTAAVLTLRKQFKVSAEEAIGFALASGTQATVTDPALVAQNLIPGISNIAATKATPRNASALLSAITQATADTTGAKSATAGVALARQLQEFLPNIGTFGERLQFVQEDEEARNVFLKGGTFKGQKVNAASFELKSRGAIESLLSGGKVKTFFDEAFKNLPKISDAESAFAEKLSQLSGSKVRGVAGIENAFGSLKDRTNIENIQGGRTSAIRKGLLENLEASGAGFLDRTITGQKLDFKTSVLGQDPKQVAIKELTRRRDFAKFEEHGLRQNTFLDSSERDRSVRESRINEAQASQLAFQKMIDVLERIDSGIKDGNKRKQINRNAHR